MRAQPMVLLGCVNVGMGSMSALEELFDREFSRLVRSLSVAFVPEDAAECRKRSLLPIAGGAGWAATRTRPAG